MDESAKTVEEALTKIVIEVTKATHETNRTLLNNDLGNIMNAVDEIEDLLGLSAAHEKLIELTSMLEEHPEGWDGPCACVTCIDCAQ